MSKGDKGQQTKQRLILATAGLLQRQGYFATGLNEVIKKSDAPKGSLYFHFPGGKDQLTAAALEQTGAAWRDKLAAVLAEAPPHPARDLQRICAALAAELETSGFANGCPMATVALETAAENEPLRALFEEHFRGWEALIEARLQSGGVPAELTHGLATLALSSIEGALILSRAYHNTKPLKQVAATLGAMANALPKTTKAASPKTKAAKASIEKPKTALSKPAKDRSNKRSPPHSRRQTR